jgi:uncharacterized protein (TIGR00730 family)
MAQRKIVVFCASSSQIDPQYLDAAREFVRRVASSGWTIVSGGGAVGVMGAISDEAHKCGCNHIGVLPGFMRGLESPFLDQTVWTGTMAERKEIMREGTFAAIALAGGIGTLDELAETITLKKLHQYGGKVLALDTLGFFQPFVSLLRHFTDTGMMQPQDEDLLHVCGTVDELMEDLLKD